MPGVAPAPLSLIRTDEVAIAISGVRAYPNGFEFTVHARVRHEDLPWGMPPIDSTADPRTRQAPEKALRLGVLHADGHRARTPGYRPAELTDPVGLLTTADSPRDFHPGGRASCRDADRGLRAEPGSPSAGPARRTSYGQ
jgi:hypothetical protein